MQEAVRAAAPPRTVQGWQPATFAERGLVIAFTTPNLVGTRLRPAERGGLELIVPNISGARSVYVVPWEGVQALCCPTLHDRRLNARLAGAGEITPAALRRVAREIAAEGLAGRAAAAAGSEALLAEEQHRLLANLDLLLDLLRQTEQRGPGWVPPERAARAEQERRSRAVLALLAPQLGRTPERLMAMLEELAAAFGPLGIGRRAAAARVPATLAALASLVADLHDWQRGGDEAAMIESAAAVTLHAAGAVLAEARARLSDLPELLRRWAGEPAAVARLAGRADWLLDGWERICLLWQSADDRIDRAAVLAEMAELVPPIPREAEDWVHAPVACRMDTLRHRRRPQRGEDWRSGLTVQDIVARNEKLRALAPGGPA